MRNLFRSLMLGLGLVISLTAVAAGDDVKTLQSRWEVVKYTIPAAEQEKAYAALADEARAMAARAPNNADILIWEGIVLSSYAGAKGGLGALSLAKEAKAALEKALEIDDKALAGSAYTSLGALLYQVPGWPIGFGDKDKARAMLQKALTINPDGMDPNFFYGDFLMRQKDYKGATAALEKARKAPPRPDRPLADEGRRKEIDALLAHPVTFDMATNGSRLPEKRLTALDGVIRTLMISFSSIDPAVYQSVHANLDQRVVMDNILAAGRLLKKTRLVINLSPTRECLDTLDDTVAWFRGNGVNDLHMSPTYYDRAGAQKTSGQPDHERLRAEIRRHGLGSQETAFIPGAMEILRQWRANRFKCVPRNTNVLISATGHYTSCFNDIRESCSLGHVSELSLREALRRREAMEAQGAICDQCNLRERYRPMELARVALSYARTRFAT